MPLVAGVLEVIDNFIFDTLHTMAPRLDRPDREKMFVIPLGAQVLTNEGHRLKDYLDTNLYESGLLNPPQQFAIRAIRCAFIGRDGISPASSRYYADTLVRLMIGQKPYWIGPAWKCADPVTMVLEPNLMDSETRIEFVRALRQTFTYEPLIQTQEPFYVEVTFGKSWNECPPDAPDRLVVLLEGALARAIV